MPPAQCCPIRASFGSIKWTQHLSLRIAVVWAAIFPLYQPHAETVTTTLPRSLLSVAQHVGLCKELWGDASPEDSYAPVHLPGLSNPALSHLACPRRQCGLHLKPNCLQMPRALVAKPCPPASQHYLFRILVAVRAEVQGRLTETKSTRAHPHGR